MNKLFISCVVCAFVFLGGCSTYSSNTRVGTDTSYVSLEGQRKAIKAVKVYKDLPLNSIVLGSVDAGRCHRETNHVPPTNENVILDLKIAAYSKGADGITNIEIDEQSGLTDNCWYVINGKAVMFELIQ